jgi:hypothetical protein
MIPHPPAIHDYAIVHERRLRFVTNAAVATAITFQNLLDLFLFAASATAVYDVFSAVRIKAVEAWAVPVIGNATTVEVTFLGATAGSVGDQVIHTDTSMGIEPAHVLARPAPRTGAALFQESSASVAFFIDAPSGTVVDVLLSLKQNLSGAAVAAQNVAAGATVGTLNVRGLDGLATAGTKFSTPGGLSSV